MRKLLLLCRQAIVCFSSLFLISCTIVPVGTQHHASMPQTQYQDLNPSHIKSEADYASRLPAVMDTDGKKTVLVDPSQHAWGAYDADGKLVRAGIATAGGKVCPPDAEDESNCRTDVGTFRITSIGGQECASKTYPKPRGGGLMPYCMYFNKGEALHGSPDQIVLEDNISHGCVRMRIPDAEWMVNHFASVGTRVVVLPY